MAVFVLMEKLTAFLVVSLCRRRKVVNARICVVIARHLATIANGIRRSRARSRTLSIVRTYQKYFHLLLAPVTFSSQYRN